MELIFLSNSESWPFFCYLSSKIEESVEIRALGSISRNSHSGVTNIPADIRNAQPGITELLLCYFFILDRKIADLLIF